MTTTMMQRSISNNDESEAMYNSRRGSITSESSTTTSWGDFQFLANSHVTPRYDASDDDHEDMFSVFAWSACSTGKEQFLRERSQFNETERENRRSITGRMDEVVALLAHQAERVVLTDDGAGDDVARDTHRGRRSSRRASAKPYSSRSEEHSSDGDVPCHNRRLQRFSLWIPDLVRI